MKKDDFAVRDPTLSVFQSAVTDLTQRSVRPPAEKAALIEAARSIVNQRIAGSNEIAPTSNFSASVAQIGEPQSCVALGLKYMESRLIGNQAVSDKIAAELKYSTCDPAWIDTIDAHLAYFGPGGSNAKIPYISPRAVGDRTITIPPNPKVALIGDWGTGGERARSVLEQVKAFGPDVLIHLGDIYYSGTPKECQENFVAIIDDVFERSATSIPVFTLAGNHDMYSGGEGYYGVVTSMNGGDNVQGASFFCLRSEGGAWQILGMDTGYNDFSPLSLNTVTFLQKDEQDWHIERLKEFKGSTILVSHHQLFSAFSAIGSVSPLGQPLCQNTNLQGSFTEFAKVNDRIAAWFWGHEHNLCIYENGYLGLARGRCIGHGSVPVLAKDLPYKPLAKIRKPPAILKKSELSMEDDAYANGFAIVTLSATAGQATADYYQCLKGTAQLVASETLN